MLSSIIAFGVALAVVTGLTPVVRWAAIGIGAVDAPSGRRVHAHTIPRLGGVAIAVAFFAPLLALFGGATEVGRIFFAEPLRIVGLATGGLLLLGTGIVDDIRGVRAWTKLALQLLAACVVFFCNYRIEAIALPLLGHLEMGVFALPVTALWIVAIVNAVNLIDGLDGLASGVTFFVCVVNFVVGALNQDPLVMMLSASLGGAVLGFLLYNWSPASIFMGDSGSLFIGLVLATTALRGNAIKSSTTIAILVPLIALGLPIMDTLFAMVRRVLERRPIFSPDRGHIHHRLLAMGVNQRRAVLMLYGLTILFTAGAILLAMGRDWQVGGALFVLSIAVIGVVRAMGNLGSTLQQWRRRERRPRAAEVERLRRAVPAAISRLGSTRELGDLAEVLSSFARSSELVGLELTGSAHARLPCFHWTSETQAAADGDDSVVASTSYPVPAAGPEAYLHFAWRAESPTVGSEVDILLQLVVDGCQERLARPEEARQALAKGHLKTV